MCSEAKNFVSLQEQKDGDLDRKGGNLFVLKRYKSSWKKTGKINTFWAAYSNSYYLQGILHLVPKHLAMAHGTRDA